MDHKGIVAPVEVKSADRGEVEAVFARFNVEDHDRDITVPGAFTEGAPVAISAYGHKTWPEMGGLPPVGRGVIKTTPDEAVLHGRFFMDTTQGREAFALVKGMGDLQAWSYGFDVVSGDPRPGGGRVLKALTVHEVSPVFQAAGIGTRTLAMKDLTGPTTTTLDVGLPDLARFATLLVAIRPHSTDTTTKAWEPADIVGALDDSDSVDALRSVFALSDPTADPATKAAYSLPHHDGPGGPANLRACVAGVASLNLDVKAAGRDGAYAHLAQHVRDSGREPSQLRDTASAIVLKDRAALVLSDLAALRQALAEVHSSRATKGKQLAALTVDTLDWVRDELRGLAVLIDTPEDRIGREYAQFIRFTREGV